MRCDVRRYLRYADAGDQFVGRTIALVGFLNSWMFAVLPPHFVEDVTPVVLELFPVCVLMPSMIPVCRLALASVVYHATRAAGGFDFPATHELMKSALFCDRQKLEALSRKLNTDLYRSDHMTATGIPPYVCLFMEIAGIPAKVKEVFQEVLRQVNILPRADESALFQLVMSKLTAIEARVSGPAEPQRPAQGKDLGSFQAYLNTKLQRFSSLPEGYKLPHKLVDLFNHWWCPSMWQESRVPALRSACVLMQDFEVAQHRAWSSCKAVMRFMDEKMDAAMRRACTSETTSVSMCTNLYANGMTAKIWGVLSIGDQARMKVTYACKLLQRGAGLKKRKRKQ